MAADAWLHITAHNRLLPSGHSYALRHRGEALATL